MDRYAEKQALDSAYYLLETSISQPIEAGVAERVVVETGGNPLAIVEAAAEQPGRGDRLWQAATALGIPESAAVRFSHPLVRSAVYHAAAPGQRREAQPTSPPVGTKDVPPRVQSLCCSSTWRADSGT
jgi:hypothetical protein